MPDGIFNNLKGFYDNPKFQPMVVKEGSIAACSLCQWVRAVYEYCTVYRFLEPKRQQLRQAEDELQKVTTTAFCFNVNIGGKNRVTWGFSVFQYPLICMDRRVIVHCWSIVGLLLFHCWSIVSPLLVHCWSIADPLLVHCWSLVSPLLVHCWSIVSPLLIYCWSIVGPMIDTFPTASETIHCISIISIFCSYKVSNGHKKNVIWESVKFAQ